MSDHYYYILSFCHLKTEFETDKFKDFFFKMKDNLELKQ